MNLSVVDSSAVGEIALHRVPKDGLRQVRGAGWSAQDIAYDCIDYDRVRNDEILFFVLTSASLVESGSDLYSSVLVDYFGDSTAGSWLRDQWQAEELQHGLALRLYIEEVWPEFDWEDAYQNFMQEYSTYCVADALEPSPALELAARCVVETGTAVLYRALQEYTQEPILKQIVGNIRRDEIRHYKYFNRFFYQYNQYEKNGRWPVFKALVRRVAELRHEDSDCALRHIFAQRYPELGVNSWQFRNMSRATRGLVTDHAATDMMLKMLLQPLQLPAQLRGRVDKTCAKLVQYYLSS